MKKTLIAAALAIALGVNAQQTSNSGIYFEHGTWAEIKAKAKKENKNIFMDAYTTWCGPCKMMARDIFPLEEAGQFFNANYINVKVQLDTTKNDNDYIKSWYKDAHDIQVGYGVRVYPTYLFISPEGKLLHRAVGSSDVTTFIKKATDALDPEKQYYTLQDKYKAGDRSPQLLRNLASAAYYAYDRDNMGVYADAYFATQKDLNNPETIKFLDLVTESSNDPGLKFMLENPAAYNAVVGDGAAEKKIRNIALREEIYPNFRRKDAVPDWDAITKKLVEKYPRQADEILNYGKIIYYGNVTQDFPAFSKEVTSYLEKYGTRFTADELNSFAWTIFSRCDDPNCIDQALQWSKKSVDLTQNHMFMDTYANLLYKKGNTKEAIVWEEKALNAAKANNSSTSDYEETLKKMKSGSKTWD